MELKNELKNLNINLSDEEVLKFETYFSFLTEYNKVCNLTAITDYEGVLIKHFYDSLLLSNALPKEKIRLLDVGAGAGFPSVPNAIVNKDLDVVIIDSLNKRIVFLNELIKKLDLNNVVAIHGRAEEYAKEEREQFDVVTARAVARLNILMELCIPFVKVGGLFVAMKSKESDQELEEAIKGIKILGCEFLRKDVYKLPYDMGERELLIFKKVNKTHLKYPRKFQQIKNKPL